LMAENRRLHGDDDAVAISAEDVVKAVESLEPLGSTLEIVKVGSRQMIRSIPKELSNDQATVLEAAQVMGFVTQSILELNFQWSSERASSVLEDLISEALVWMDDQAHEREYWVSNMVNS